MNCYKKLSVKKGFLFFCPIVLSADLKTKLKMLRFFYTKWFIISPVLEMWKSALDVLNPIY